MSTRSRQGVTIYNSNSDCELRRRKLRKDRSCKYLSEVLHRPVCKAHKDKLERESSSNFDNDNTYDLLATTVNRTGLWFLTTGMNKHGLNCMSQAMPRVLKFVSLRFHCDIVSWNGLFTLSTQVSKSPTRIFSDDDLIFSQSSSILKIVCCSVCSRFLQLTVLLCVSLSVSLSLCCLSLCCQKVNGFHWLLRLNAPHTSCTL